MLNFRITKYDNIESTNKVIRQLPNLQEGTVLTAEGQTQGRGYGQNIWESEYAKNLLLSIFLKPDFLSADKQFFISIATSLAIANTIEAFCKPFDTKIKWPNDVYVSDKKICGILIENSISGAKISSTIVGIGLNVNQLDFKNNIPNPISMANLSQSTLSKELILDHLLENFNNIYKILKARKLQQLEDEYINRMYRYKQMFEFQSNNHRFRGEIQGIDTYGQLKISIDNDVKTFGFKELEYII